MNLDRIVMPAALPLDVAAARSQVRQDSDIDDADLGAYIRAARRFAETECKRTLIATRFRLTLDGFPEGVLTLEYGPVLAVRSITYLDDAGSWQTVDASVYVTDLGAVGRIDLASGQSWPTAASRIGSVRVTYDAGDAAAVTVATGTDVFTIKGGMWSALAVGDVVRLSNSGGRLPAPLAADTDYYVHAVPTATTFKLAATADGSAIDIVSAGAGTHYIGAVPEDVQAWMRLRIGGMFENREDMADGRLLPLPYIDRMLDGARLY